MSDPTTELAKEFLEIHNYSVRKETKFFKNKELSGTPSDIDILATGPKAVKIGDVILKENIVAESKNWGIEKQWKVDEIYKDKFKHIDNPEVSWKQLKKYISSRKFDKVIFCLATTEDVYKYALKKYCIKIITSGFIIKSLANFVKTSNRTWSYYPEWYHYNTIRTILLYSYYTKYKDKPTLEDLVWIDPDKESLYRNKFNKLNGRIMANFLYHDDENLIYMMERDPKWFLNEIIKICLNKNKNYLKEVLQKTLKKV